MKTHTFIGRLTADAEVRNLEGGKTVVHFTIAETVTISLKIPKNTNRTQPIMNVPTGGIRKLPNG